VTVVRRDDPLWSMLTQVPSEDQEQRTIIDWWRVVGAAKYDLPPELLFAVPNGGQRNLVVAKKLKAEGVVAGVPDLCLAVGWGDRHCLWIELKRRKGGKVSQAQQHMHSLMRLYSGAVCVCRGADEAISCICTYLDKLFDTGLKPLSYWRQDG